MAEGYAVIFPEYRGSRGYGAEQYKVQDYGGKDLTDVLDAADYYAGGQEAPTSSKRPRVDSGGDQPFTRGRFGLVG